MISMGEQIDDEIVSEMMALADINHDGKVDFEEFVRAALGWNCSFFSINSINFNLFI